MTVCRVGWRRSRNPPLVKTMGGDFSICRGMHDPSYREIAVARAPDAAQRGAYFGAELLTARSP